MIFKCTWQPIQIPGSSSSADVCLDHDFYKIGTSQSCSIQLVEFVY